MTKLRQKMIEDLQLKGLSTKTQKAYVSAVRMLAEYFRKSPADITEEDLRKYFLYLKNEKKYSSSSTTVALCGIKFFYEKTLNKEFTTLTFVKPVREKKLPVILSQKEVQAILRKVRKPVYRTCLTTIYTCGLRNQEACNLQVHQIDSARMLLHIGGGKGNKDRLIPLPKITLELLRKFWQTHKNPTWLFPKGSAIASERKREDGPINSRSLQRAFILAAKDSGIHKKACVHSLRHAYATHLVEEGLNLKFVQIYLGHNSLSTTAIYTHLTTKSEEKAHEIINNLANNL